ncbi:hypothetical protein MNV49_002061 [Pseudohyphozyma bogoriensis]|nr:hypothetical protein MNV49_002061 [Pseudohyphozyma bogoriensis]
MAKKNGSTVATQAPQPSSNWKALKQALKPASASPPSAKRKRTSATTTVTTTTTVVETPKLALEKGKGKQRESEHGDDDARSKGKKEIPVDEILSGGTAAWQAEPGQYLAIDCEMVGVGPEGSESTLARVSIVNYHGVVMLDRFVRQRELVTDYRTWVSGIREEDLRNAPTFAEVQKEVAELIKGRILIGHAISNDTQVLLLSHPWTMTRDTAKYPPLQGLARTKKPGLKTLAKLCLGVDIQAGEHSSVDDARATMAIYRSQKTAWEDSLRVHSKPSLVTTSTPALQNLDLSNISITGVKKSHKPKSLGLAATMRSLRAEREKEAEENGEVGMGEVEAELRDQRKRAREEEDDMVVGFDFAPKAKAVKMAEVEREVVKKEGEKKKAKKATGKSFKGDKEKRPASKAGWWEEE